MARFYPLYCRRSDGKREIVSKGKLKEVNQPTDDQLDQRPDKNGISDYYREVALDETKHLDWRRKLGGMLARELKWKDKSGGGEYVQSYNLRTTARNLTFHPDNGYILVSFPENYRLYEHIKKTEVNGKTEVKSKTHAAGGNDRQDAYLYGHPQGKRKRFRSPNDFFPHLLWLCTDETGDPDNCSCKICCPEELESLVPGAKVKMERTVSQDNKPAPSTMPAAQAQIPLPRSESGQSVSRQISAPQQRVPTPLPQPRNADQKLDLQYGLFMYRPGELVWFKRGQAWGLGAVLRRWLTGPKSYSYSVQPLSFPINHPASVVKTLDSEMRPWLAWSVPRFTMDGLNQLPSPPRYESADWQGMMSSRYGNGDLEVDASILAAKAVDSSYTLIDQTRSFEPEPNVLETHYGGMFLGAERIWAGDPVRLVPGTGIDIMVVHSFVEQKKLSPINKQMIMHRVQLLGDTYTLAQVSHQNSQMPTLAAASANPHLPQRLTEDLKHRNERSVQVRRVASYWRLVGAQQRIDLDAIKGRWYEASLILPILEPGRYEELSRKGDIQESSLWMNARGDCLNSNRANLPRIPRENIRKQTRKDAFGRAIPPAAEIRDGIQPPVTENVDPGLEAPGTNEDPIDIDPKFDTAENAEGQAGLDEFMNLDGMDEAGNMSNFGQEFGQGTGYY